MIELMVGPLLVVGMDPIEISLHQLMRGQPAGSVGRMNVVDRRLYDLKRWRHVVAALTMTERRVHDRQRHGYAAAAVLNVCFLI